MTASESISFSGGPDPGAARQVAFEARRMQSAGRWGNLLLAVGAGETAFGLAMGFEQELPQLPKTPMVGPLLFGTTVSFFLVLRWALQRRARRQIDAGLPQPSWPGVPESLTFAAIAAALALVVAGACSIWFDFEAAWDSFLPVLLLSVSGAAALLACWYAYRLRLWEYALAASGVAAALAILSLYGEPAAMWGVCSFGLAFFVSGLFLRRRWRHWMSAHPAKGERA